MNTEPSPGRDAPGHDKSPEAALRGLILPVAAAVVLLVVGFGAALWWIQAGRIEDATRRSLSAALAAFQKTLEQNSDQLTSTLRAIASSREVADAMAGRDPRRLYSETRSLFADLRREHGITHLYFMDPERRCLLRVHEPGTSGDRIERFTAREAEGTGKPSSGIELGPFGTLTLRAVMPVFSGGALTGLIELGQEIETVLGGMQRDAGIELAVTVGKTALDRERWEKGMAMLGRVAEWEQFPGVVLVYYSAGRPPAAFEPFIGNIGHAAGRAQAEIDLDGEAWRLSTEKLMDASGLDVGDLIIAQSLSAHKAAFRQLNYLAAGAIAAVASVLGGFLFVALRRTGRVVARREDDLRQSRESYRLLFEEMNSGFVLHEMIYNGHGKPGDCLIMEVNPAFELTTGLSAGQMVGKRLLEVLPLTDRNWLEYYGRVAETGKPVHFEGCSDDLRKVFEVRAFRPAHGQVAAIFHDITERRQVEQEVRRSVSRLRSLVDILKQSAETTQEFLDFALHEAIKLTGSKIGYIYHYDEERKQFVLNSWSREVMQECRMAKPQTCYELGKTGVWGEAVRQRRPIVLNRYQAEHPLKKGYPEGHVRLHRFMTVPLFKANRIVAVVGVANKESDYDETDQLQLALLMDSVFKVVELKQAEEALRLSEERYKLLYTNAPMPYQSLDESGRLLEVNQAWLDALGYTKEEVIGRDFGAFLHSDWTGHFNAQFPKFKAVGEILGTEFEMRKKDGSVILVSFNGRIARDREKRFLQTHCVFTDITDRRKAENAIRESEERFRLAFRTSPDAVNINRLADGLYVDINEGFTALTGYTREDVIGRTSLEIQVWDNPEDRQRLVRELNAKGFCENLEARFRKKDGSLTTALMSARVVPLQGIPHILSITRDISERVQAEQQREKLEAQLRQAQKMEAIGTLAGGIAHDFNNILSVIIGSAEMLAMDNAASLSNSEGLRQILAAGQRAKQLVRQILAFSRHSEQQRLLVNLKPVITETIGFLRASLPTSIELRHHIDPDPGVVTADPTQIQQVLMNLCTNALHAMEDNGGVLRIELDNVVISEADGRLDPRAEPGNFVRLTVTDTGHGMEPRVKERIFDPYFTTKGPGRGTGLGLSVVHGIVTSHGGLIKVYSEAGQGTSFQVLLPRAGGIEQAEPETAPEPARGTETILFVDDEPALVDLGRRMLGWLGYQVEVRTSPIEALALFQADPDRFDAVIADMTMPQMTGLKLAREIRAIRPSIPFVICTGFSDRTIEAKVQAAGISAFLYKPLVIADLAGALRRVLDEGERNGRGRA